MSTTTDQLELNGVAVADTFAEAFPIVATRVIITAATGEWARIAADEMCGFATSVIACDAEAAVEREITADESFDGRPGFSVLVFAFSRDALAQAVANRVGQCVLTCPTTACFNGLEADSSGKHISVGGQLRFFGDGFQASKKLGAKRLWRIPVMDGEFICEDRFGTVKGVAGGNLLIAGRTGPAALSAATAAASAMKATNGVALPFPGGIVRSGSKVGSKYKGLKASTNHAWCPSLRHEPDNCLPDDATCVYEIVADGLDFDCVQASLRDGLHAACATDGVVLVSAGNYGGKLGPHHFHLRDLIS